MFVTTKVQCRNNVVVEIMFVTTKVLYYEILKSAFWVFFNLKGLFSGLKRLNFESFEFGEHIPLAIFAAQSISGSSGLRTTACFTSPNCPRPSLTWVMVMQSRGISRFLFATSSARCPRVESSSSVVSSSELSGR